MNIARRNVSASISFLVAWVTGCFMASGCQQQAPPVAQPPVPASRSAASESPAAFEKPASTPAPAEVLMQIRQDLTPAAGMPIEDFVSIAYSGAMAVEHDETDNQPLSRALLCMSIPFATNALLPEALRELRPLDEHSKFARSVLAKPMTSRSQEQGYCSVIQTENVRDVQGTLIDTMTVVGKATFIVPDSCEVTVNYRAKKTSDKWQVSEFRLPAWGIEVVKNQDGIWKIGGAQFLYPRFLAGVDFADPPRDLSPGATLWLGLTHPSAGLPPGAIALQGLKQPLALSTGQEEISTAVKAHLREQPKSDEPLVIRLNIGQLGTAHWSDVEKVLKALRAGGCAEVRLGVSAYTVVDPSQISQGFIQVAAELPLKLNDSTTSDLVFPVVVEQRSTLLSARVGEKDLFLSNLSEHLSKMQPPVEVTGPEAELVLDLHVIGADQLRTKDVLSVISACLGRELPGGERKGERFRARLRWEPSTSDSVDPAEKSK